MADSTVADVMVRTLDGDEVAIVDALTLSWDRVLKAKLATRQPALKGALQGLLDSDPRKLAVARADTPQATKLAGVIEQIKVEGDLPVWVPLAPTLDAWKKRQADAEVAREVRTQNAEQASADALREAQERARRKAEQRKREAEAAQVAAAALGEFIPEDVQAKRADRRDERREARTKAAAVEELIGPFTQGYACVDDNRQPTALTVGGQTVPTLNFRALANQVKNGIGAEHVVVPCAFCHQQNALGETIPWRKRLEDGSTEERRVFVARQIQFKARTADGRNEYTFLHGDRKGQSQRISVAVCRRCAGIATRISPQVPDSRNPGKTMPSALPTDIYPKFVRWLENQMTKDGSRTVASVGPDGRITEMPTAAQSTRNASAPQRTSGGPSGPIGDATQNGLSVNPMTREEGFVAPAAESPRLGASIGERIASRARR